MIAHQRMIGSHCFKETLLWTHDQCILSKRNTVINSWLVLTATRKHCYQCRIGAYWQNEILLSTHEWSPLPQGDTATNEWLVHTDKTRYCYQRMIGHPVTRKYCYQRTIDAYWQNEILLSTHDWSPLPQGNTAINRWLVYTGNTGLVHTSKTRYCYQHMKTHSY